MKKRTYLFSKAMAISTVAVLSGGILTLNSCKKNEDTLTEIKVQDTEDTEKTSQTELTEKYQYLKEVAMDSINKEITALQIEKDRVIDSLKAIGVSVVDISKANAEIAENAKKNDADIADQVKRTDDELEQNGLSLAQQLQIALDEHTKSMEKEDAAIAQTLATNLLAIEAEQRKASVDSATKAIEIAELVSQMNKKQAIEAEDLKVALEEIAGKLITQETMTAAELKGLNDALFTLSNDSITNAYLLEQAELQASKDGSLAEMTAEKELYDKAYANALDTVGDANDMIYNAQQSLYDFYVQLDVANTQYYTDSTGNVVSKIGAENTHELALIDIKNTHDLALVNKAVSHELDVMAAESQQDIDLAKKQVDTALALVEALHNIAIDKLKRTQAVDLAMVVVLDGLDKAKVEAELAHQVALREIEALQMLANGDLDYLVGKSVLTVNLYEVLPNGTKVPFAGTATITVGQKTVADGVADTAAWEGQYYVTVAATGYLTTSFYATIADNLSDEKDLEDATFNLFENEIKVTLVSTIKTFSIEGVMAINNVEPILFDTLSGTEARFLFDGNATNYIKYLNTFDPFVKEAGIKFTYDLMNVGDIVEPYEGLTLTLKVEKTGSSSYVSGGAGVNTIADVLLETADTEVTATTDATGAFAFADVPVLNGDFKVSVAWESSQIKVYKEFWGTADGKTPEAATDLVWFENGTTLAGSSVIPVADREGTFEISEEVAF